MKKFLVFMICLASLGYAYPQTAQPEVVATAGDYFKGANHSMSWTLGECITDTYTSGSNTLTQGFQQSTYTITSVKQPELNGISIKAYPNPTTDFVTVTVEALKKQKGNYSLELFDVLGKRLKTEKITDDKVQLNMGLYRSGTYLLKVSNTSNNTIKTFKIEKK